MNNTGPYLKKRLLALLLVILMVIHVMPMGVYAQNPGETDSVVSDSGIEDPMVDDLTEDSTAEDDTVEEESDGEDTVEDDSAEDSTVEDDTVEDDTAEDDTVEDDIVEDDTTEDDMAEDDSVEDSTVEDDTVEDNTVEDDTAKDDTIEDDVVEDNTLEDDEIEDNTAEEDGEELPEPIQDQLNAMLEALKPYLDKERLTSEDAEAMRNGLSQIELYCMENSISLTEEQLELYSLLSSAVQTRTTEGNDQNITSVALVLEAGTDNVLSSHATLAEAVAQADSGNVITLTQSLAGGPIKIEEKSITIDLGGHTYTVTEVNENAVYVVSGAGLVLQNGVVQRTEASSYDLLSNYGNTTLINMTMRAEGTSYGVYSYLGSLTLTDTTVTADYALGLFSEADIHVSLNGATVINGTIELGAFDADVPCKLKLDINNATVNGELIVYDNTEDFVITKAESCSLKAPSGFTWEDNVLVKTLDIPENSIAMGWNEANQSDLKYIFEMEDFEDALAYFSYITIMKDFSLDTPLKLMNSITLDFGGNVLTYTGTSDDYAVTIHSGVDVALQNGSIVASEDASLVWAAGDLSLKNMVLNSSAESYALICGEKDGGANNAIFLTSGNTLSGKILVLSDNCKLHLAGATLTDCELVFGSSFGGQDIYKAEAQTVTIPEGLYWDRDVMLAEKPDAADEENAIAVGDDGQYYDDLQQAVDNNTVVTLLKNVFLEEPLILNKGVALDLNGLAISYTKLYEDGSMGYGGNGIRAVYGSSTIKNGYIYGTLDNGYYLHLAGGNVTLDGVHLGTPAVEQVSLGEAVGDAYIEPKMAENGVYVEGSAVGASSFTMVNSYILASFHGIFVEPNHVLDAPNSVTVKSGGICAQVGIADQYTVGPQAFSETQEQYGYAARIQMSGGDIIADIGIIHTSDGPLNFAGGSIQAESCGIRLMSPGAANISAGSIAISSTSREETVGVFQCGSGSLMISGSANIQGGVIGVTSAGGGNVTVSGGAISGSMASMMLYSSNNTTRATILGGSFTGPVGTDDNIGDSTLKGSTALYRAKGIPLVAAVMNDGGQSTCWYSGDGVPVEMERFIFGEPEPLKATILWVGDQEDTSKRPDDYQQITVTPRGTPAAEDKNGVRAIYQIPAQKGDTWTQELYMSSATLGQIQENGYDAEVTAPDGYEASMKLTLEEIEITFTRKPDYKTVPKSSTYYVEKVRVWHPYAYGAYSAGADGSGSLLQTGQETLPILGLGIAGISLLALGIYLISRKKGRYEK